MATGESAVSVCGQWDASKPDSFITYIKKCFSIEVWTASFFLPSYPVENSVMKSV